MLHIRNDEKKVKHFVIFILKDALEINIYLLI